MSDFMGQTLPTPGAHLPVSAVHAGTFSGRKCSFFQSTEGKNAAAFCISISITAWPTWQKSRRNRQLWATLLSKHVTTSVSVLNIPPLLPAELFFMQPHLHQTARLQQNVKKKKKKMWRCDVGLHRLLVVNSEVCLCVYPWRLGNWALADGRVWDSCFLNTFLPIFHSHKGINFSTSLAETGGRGPAETNSRTIPAPSGPGSQAFKDFCKNIRTPSPPHL